jgi:hydroxyacylglutathione hydrolase
MPLSVPLEDNFTDIIAKAQRGLSLNNETLANRSGTSVLEIENLKSGTLDEGALRKVAKALGLGAEALWALAESRYKPNPVNEPEGLASFNSVFDDMTVNSFVVGDPQRRRPHFLTPARMANRCWISPLVMD